MIMQPLATGGGGGSAKNFFEAGTADRGDFTFDLGFAPTEWVGVADYSVSSGYSRNIWSYSKDGTITTKPASGGAYAAWVLSGTKLTLTATNGTMSSITNYVVFAR